MSERVEITMSINGLSYTRQVEPRMLLADFLRHGLGLTGTHVGCEHGVCGCCTELLDGRPVRSCLLLAVQARDHEGTTIEGLATDGSPLHPVQKAFHECHGLQCGFCTAGFLMVTAAFVRDHPDPSDSEINEATSGNLCRCTGYANIRRSVRRAAELSGGR